MKKILLSLLLLIVVLVGVLIFNTMMLKAPPVTHAEPLITLPDSAINHLQTAIRIPTVSLEAHEPIDTLAFKNYTSFLKTSYPLIHQQLELQVFNQFSFLYKWTGKDTTLPPFVLMAHYDVVPVEEATASLWQQPAFSGNIIGDTLWGRGTCDDKSQMISILEAVEYSLAKGLQPARTIYLSFGHDEELGGNLGAASIAGWMKTMGIKPALVIDEGGIITIESKMATRPLAVIGVQEKGYTSYRLTVERPGGHSSQPEAESAISIMTQALNRLYEHPSPPTIIPVVDAFLEASGSISPSWVSKMAIANRWLLGSMVMKKMGEDKRTNAMIRTTIAPTIINAGIKDNVIPGISTAVVNCRILPGETPESVRAYLQKQVNDERVKIAYYDENVFSPSMATDINGREYKLVANTVSKVMDSVVAAPFIMIGASDGRYFRQVSDGVINFSATTFLEGYHGINERIPLKEFQRMFSFMVHLISSSK